MKPSRRYYQFHGRKPRRYKSRRFYAPETLIRLGRVEAIEYESDKWHGGGDGTVAIYRHEFETPAWLYMDERGRHQLYILGDRIAVTADGVIN